MGWILQEYNDAEGSNQIAIFGNNWEAETFTPAVAHNCKKVAMTLKRTGDLAGVSYIISIKATDGGDPSGDDLISKTIDGNDIGTDDFVEVEFEFDDVTALDDGVMYAIVHRLDGGDSSHYIEGKVSGNEYADGQVERSTNAGDSWSGLTSYDYLFKEYEWEEEPSGPAIASFNGVVAASISKVGGVPWANIAKVNGVG